MAIPQETRKIIDTTVGSYKFGFRSNVQNKYQSPKGLTEEVVRELSEMKKEPQWMLDFRLRALDTFHKKAMPEWGGDLSKIDFENIHYYIKPQEKQENDWQKVNPEIKNAFDILGIPEAEKTFLAATSAQFESEVVYKSVQEALSAKGVVFDSTENGLKEHPEIFKEHFGKIIPPNDNKFAALNSAVWSGGSFIYVPKGVEIDLPLQAYFRMNTDNMGQFERTLIIADEGAKVHYIEGCTAPVSSANSLHAAVVEIVVKKGARVQYTTLQDWAHNIYNLVTKRAHAHENAEMFWLDCNIGSRLTMKYPSIYLMGRGARGEVQSLAFAGKNQHQDAGAKIIHAAPDTSSTIVSKSISKDSGHSTYRGLIKVNKGAKNVKSKIACDALLLDPESRSDTYPTNQIEEDEVTIAHEATVSKLGEEQMFYLMSRGLSEEEAGSMIVNGFADPIIKQLPMEYALELNRLIDLEMTGSVG